MRNRFKPVLSAARRSRQNTSSTGSSSEGNASCSSPRSSPAVESQLDESTSEVKEGLSVVSLFFAFFKLYFVIAGMRQLKTARHLISSVCNLLKPRPLKWNVRFNLIRGLKSIVKFNYLVINQRLYSCVKFSNIEFFSTALSYMYTLSY